MQSQTSLLGHMVGAGHPKGEGHPHSREPHTPATPFAFRYASSEACGDSQPRVRPPYRTRREFRSSTGDGCCGHWLPTPCSPMSERLLHHGNTPASGDVSCTCLQAKRPWVDLICHLCTLSQTPSKMQVPLRCNVLKLLLPKPSWDHPFPGQVAQPSPPWSRTPRNLVHKEMWVASLICNWETGADSRIPS